MYLKRLKMEIEDRYMGDSIKTIYIGGGTPSCLSLKEIEYLLKLTNIFKKDELEEFTFECNIEDITEDLLVILKKYGVNRLSIGIESFDQDNLILMHRENTYEDTYKKMQLMRKMGFNNINLDLIYALPGESLNLVKKDLNYFLKLNPEHISTYSLMIEDNTYLSYQKVKTISEDIDYKMYDYIQNKLKHHNYVHYEVSNFAKPGYESKHNLVYWHNLEYYGFGCGASGYIDGVRYNNTRSLTNYLKGDIRSTEEIISKQGKMEYELILGLRKIKGINVLEFNNKYNVLIEDIFPIKPLIKNKDLILKNNYLYINPKKIYIMNEILLKLV